MIRFNSSKLKAFAQTLVCAIAVFMLSPNAIAQSSADLPRSTVEAISISASQRTQIDSFVSVWSSRALSEKAQDSKRAMEALTTPLQGRGVSVAFRQAYTQAITALMNELDAADTIGATISSLRLAGELATPAGVARVKAAMNNDDLGIQIFAVSRAGEIFNSTKSGPAITPNDANTLINAINSISSKTDIDPTLLGACVRSLSTATTMPSKDMGDARSNAIVALANAVGPHLRALNVHDNPSFAQSLGLEAASAMTASIADISSQTNADAVKAAVGLGGDIISVSLRRVFGKTIEPVADRELTVRSVQAGETLLYFSLRKDAELSNKPTGSVRQTGFADQLAAGDDRDFRNDASRLLGDGSPICKRFKFVDGRFVR